jgi:hypothetical protein
MQALAASSTSERASNGLIFGRARFSCTSGMLKGTAKACTSEKALDMQALAASSTSEEHILSTDEQSDAAIFVPKLTKTQATS